MSVHADSSDLARDLSGEVIWPDSPSYDQRRRVWNSAVDRRPAAIVRPENEKDVRIALTHAADQGRAVTVRGGGHNAAGYAVADGAIMLDLSGWHGVEVDRVAATAAIRAGARWGEVDEATQRVGLATTGADMSRVGAVGSTVGGGFGWLHRRFGLSCDNLVSARLITAAGEALTVDTDHDPDMFWALRGAGGAFGVVTSMTLRLHELQEVWAAIAVFPAEAALAGLRRYREMTADAPAELFVRAMLLAQAPPVPFVPPHLHGRAALLLVGVWVGDRASARAGLGPLREAGSMEPQAMPYLALQRMADAGAPSSARIMDHGFELDGISDGLLEALVAGAQSAPGPAFLSLQPGGGALAAVEPGATSFALRDASHYLHVADWSPQTGRSWFDGVIKRVRPHTTGATPPNFADPHQASDLAAEVYGANLPRLRAIKSRLDPDNRFPSTPLGHNQAGRGEAHDGEFGQ